MNKFYLIDKPIDFSSFDIIKILRKKLNIKKIGHTWTLDPLATWCLLVATWNYTKLIHFLEKDTKEYEFNIRLDWKTESFDLWTEIEYISDQDKQKAEQDISIEKINKILEQKFTWTIIQIPPKYSALKINWKRACDLMREWKNVTIKSREVNIYNIEIINYNYPDILLKAKVSAWTYIRSIASDLWNILWTWGYITKLIRTKIWNIDLKNAQQLDDFDNDNSLNEKNIFNNSIFISLEQKYLDELNNWKVINKKFNFEINTNLFIYKDNKITNIVKYNGIELKQIRRIII
jgi:tRNA pseudouridine55 synthase